MDCGLYCFSVCFFFKQKTAYEMRISDWSSDVCSSDLGGMSDRLTRTMPVVLGIDSSAAACSAAVVDGSGVLAREYLPLARGHAEVLLPKIGRASCRERVCQYV